MFGKRKTYQNQNKRTLDERDRIDAEAERESEKWVERMLKNPFIDVIMDVIDKSIEACESSPNYGSSYGYLPSLGIYNSYVYESGYGYYYSEYNLPNLELAGQLGLAKAIKIKLAKKGYDCGIAKVRDHHINYFSDEIDIHYTIGYEVCNIKKAVVHKKVTGTW